MELINSTYEILEEIGSGGSGVVYLANHVRLNKKVVLKADKRKLTTRPELLRREVDILKNLNHPYIPKVYDFFTENGTVYTAMDYIDGESLDKCLERGKRFSQPQVIRWAIQLLKALVYLHAPTHGKPPRGYVHSDIKPKNIMLRENGEVCLIDFNISLALGEENVIGISPGYASPEHYEVAFSSRYSSDHTDHEPITETIAVDESGRTIITGEDSRNRLPEKRSVTPDARSDIYSLGATLYHLLTGKCPARDAKRVTPISTTDNVSPAVAAIVNKAIRPEPDERYQTAAEMLWDFEHLHENDPRTRRLKREKRIVAGILTALFLCGGTMALAGNTQMRIQAKLQEEQERMAKEAEQRAKDALELVGKSQAALHLGNADGARELASDALEKDTQYNAQAQYALTEALGLYDLRDGYRAYQIVTLPSEIIKQSVSPDGSYAAFLTSGAFHVIELASGQVSAVLPTSASALNDAVFTKEETLLYGGENAFCAYDPHTGRELWRIDGVASGLTLSGDGSVAAVSNTDGATLYRTDSGELLGSVSYGGLRRSAVVNDVFADPEDDIFALDETGRYLAVSFQGGALKLFDSQDADGEIEIFDRSNYTFFEGGFYDHWFGFVASDGANSDFYAIDMNALDMAGSMSAAGTMRLRVDDDGFCLSQHGVLVRLDIESGQQTELAFTESGIAAIARAHGITLLKTSDDKLLFYDGHGLLFDRHDNIPCDFMGLAGEYAVLSDRDSANVRIMKLQSHADQQLFTYDPSWTHDEARVSTNRETVMLYDYHGFRLYAMDGTVLAELVLPDTEQVYDQQYRRGDGGDYLEVVYNDGTIRTYSAADGTLLSESAGEKQNASLDEEFITERYRITAPLHGTPEVYDKATGEKLRELQTDDYLAYVTEVDGGYLTEYITSDGQRYGLLLNEEWEELARLQDLCDILPDGTLVFDDQIGNLRESRAYSTHELLTLAKEKH